MRNLALERAYFLNDENEDDVLLEQELKRQASVGGWEIAHELAPYPHVMVNSNLPEELKELEKNIKALISEGKYSYYQLEKFLISLGYNQNKIRKCFRNVTGVDPEYYLNPLPDNVLPPGEIPSINYGWGQSKDKKYDYYFIMPFRNGYSIFGQKDIVRDEIIEYMDLQEAIKHLTKLVKKPYIFDKILSEPVIQEDKKLIESFNPKVKEVDDLLTKIYITSQDNHKAAEEVLDLYLTNNDISLEEYSLLRKKYGLSLKAEDVPAEMAKTETFKPEQQMSSDPLKDVDVKTEFKKSLIPEEQFKKEVQEAETPSISDLIDKIYSFFAKKSNDLEEYSLVPVTLTYKKKEVLDTGSLAEEPNIFNSDALVTVIFRITHEPLNKSKMGVSVFLVKDKDILFSGTFKGVDNEIYGFDKEALDKYFANIIEESKKEEE